MVRLDGVTLKQLRALQAVLDLGSLTQAADRLGLTPPAVHNQIKTLEATLGFAVVQRSVEDPGAQATPQGAALRRAADQIAAILSQATQQISALSRGQVGHVSLGVVSTGKYFAPGLVRLLNDLCPEIDIALRVGNRETIIAELDRGAIALAIMGRPPSIPAVLARPLGPHPHGIILPPDHPLAADRHGFDPAALLQERLILREEGSGTRALMQRFLETLGEPKPARVIEMDSNETIKQAVIAGLGVAMLSLHTCFEELRQGRLVLLAGRGLPVMRHWYLVTRSAPALDPAATRLADQILNLNGQFFPKIPQD